MRLFMKTASYGVTHIIVATAVVYAMTGNFLIALSVGLIEPIIQTIVFSVHEYMWEKDRNPLIIRQE